MTESNPHLQISPLQIVIKTRHKNPVHNLSKITSANTDLTKHFEETNWTVNSVNNKGNMTEESYGNEDFYDDDEIDQVIAETSGIYDRMKISDLRYREASK